MRNRLRIAVLIYSMTNAVIFGAAIITVLNVPALSTNAYIWIPVVVVASLIVAAPIAWLIAPLSASTVRSVAHKTVMATHGEPGVISRPLAMRVRLVSRTNSSR